MDDRLAVALDQMLEASSNAIEFTDNMTMAQFMVDTKTQRAVMMCFIVIGESAGRIGQRFPNFIEHHADWEWASMRAMRNLAAHAYTRVEFDQVWKTTRESPPALLTQIDALGPLDHRA